MTACPVWASPNLSAWVYPGTSGRMIRQPDAQGNRVLDYSGVGYKRGTVPIPNVPTKASVSPVAGDNRASIQAAIDYVSSLPLGTNGFRGAVQLAAGYYAVSNSIKITASGVVLRGAGDGSDTTSNTTLYATYIGTDQTSSLVLISNGTSYTKGTTHNITNNYVPVGACSFNVDSTSGFSVGTTVFVYRPSPANWIQALGMDQVSPAWSAGGYDLYSDRTIVRIEGNTIILNGPITCALDQQYGGGKIFSYTWPGRITNVGVEKIRGASYFNPAVTSTIGASSAYPADENHTWDFIHFYGAVADGWVRNVTAVNFAYSCVHLESTDPSVPGVRGITVRDCTSLDPVSVITGGRRYAFDLDYSGDILVQNCYTRNDRHQFVTHSQTTGPNVFVDGVSDIGYNDCGPHFRWATGAIWDNVTVNGDSANGVLAVRNRGNLGTSHGWAGANEVVWNAKAAQSNGGFTVESPPTARNWLIGGIGKLQSNSAAIPFPAPAGTYDSVGTNVFPNSLYYAQLQDRLAAPDLQTRDYWLGQMHQFVSGSAGDVVTVDFTWRSTVQAAAGTAQVSNFDVVANNQWVPFTFNFSLGPNERIVGATLSMAMRSSSGTSTNETLYLNSIANGSSFSSLGWLPIGTGTNTTVRVLDLGNQLNLLNNGILNVAVKDDVGVDWAMLELQVAPVQTLVTNTLLPVADTFVQGGSNAANNFGTNPTIDVKNASTADLLRQGYLRWSLSGVAGSVVQARVRLTPVSVDTNGLEHAIAITTSNSWSETGVTWNSQPGGEKRFATWIPSANVPVEFDVTPQVQAAMAGDGQLSLELFSLGISTGSGSVGYASRESSDSATRPQLILSLVPAPQFTNFSFVSGSGFALSGTGPAGQGYHIYAAPNLSLPLSSWSVLSTGTFNGGAFNFTDVQAVNFNRRFYRLSTP